MNERFSTRLKLALKEKKMSQAELSRKTGISTGSISDYLSDRYEAKQDKVYLIAKALQVDEGWLMGYSTDKNTKQRNDKKIETIAAHIDEDVTDEEMEEIIRYIEYIKNHPKN